MFVSLSEWKVIEAFDKFDSIEPQQLKKKFEGFDNINNRIESLVERGIIRYFSVGNFYSEYTSYNLNPIGKIIAKRGFFLHNATEVWVRINKKEGWSIFFLSTFVAVMLAKYN